MRLTSILVIIGLVAMNATAQTASKSIHFNLKKSLAIEGYDPVSYFNGKPLMGKADMKYESNGAVYWFANNTNQERFKANPAQYEPAYGGWCAYAMGESGEKVKVDPETFKILDGKLYLFYNFWGNNTLTDWNKNEKTLKLKADQNWKKILQ
jgi:YHS domain-containing protein